MLAFLDPPEMILIAVVVLVVFGGSQLPKLAKNLGKAQQEFKAGLAISESQLNLQPERGSTLERSPSSRAAAKSGARRARS